MTNTHTSQTPNDAADAPMNASAEHSAAATVATANSPASDKNALQPRIRRWGAWYQAEATLRAMRAYGGVIVFSSTFVPMLFVLAMGIGLGALMTDGAEFAAYGADSYLMYIAPAIMVSTAAMTAGIEFTFPVFEGFVTRRKYYGAQATALTPQQIALGHIIGASFRFVIHCAIFAAVLFAFGVYSSPWSLAMIISGVLGSLALGLPIMAFISSLKEEKGNAALIQRFVVMPLFLFSATFYPLSNLPIFMQPIGWVSPLWHANELGRVLAFNQPTPAWLIIVHIAFLLAMIGGAWLIIRRNYIRRLGPEEWRGRTLWAKAEAKRLNKQAAADAQLPEEGAKNLPPIKYRTGFGANFYSGNIRAVFSRGLLAIRNNRGIIFISGLLEPLLYLTSFGLGISPMVGEISYGDAGSNAETVGYAAFIAPALLAVSAMNGAVFDSTWNVFFKLKITKIYQTMMSTSLGPMDVTIGEIGLALFRGGVYALGFLTVLVVGGIVNPLAAVAMWAMALLIALGFACLGMAGTTFMKRFQQMDWLTMGLIPMILFSATLFPIDVYPTGVQYAIQALPLWHGVEVMRDIAFSGLDLGLLGHISYFLVMTVVGLVIVLNRMKAMFLK